MAACCLAIPGRMSVPGSVWGEPASALHGGQPAQGGMASAWYHVRVIMHSDDLLVATKEILQLAAAICCMLTSIRCMCQSLLVAP